jgi:hypothetical protein
MNDAEGSGGPVFLNLWQRREFNIFLLEPIGPEDGWALLSI